MMSKKRCSGISTKPSSKNNVTAFLRRPARSLSLRQHHSSIWWEDYEALFDQKADILVTHEGPSCHRFGFKPIDDLDFALGVKRLFHGHHHTNYQTIIEQGGSEVIVDGGAWQM